MDRLVFELDPCFYSRNYHILEKQRKQHKDNNNVVLRLIENSINASFREADGWVMVGFFNYIELYKDSWTKTCYGHKRNICFEIGFFDCGGNKCLCIDNLKVSVSAHILSTSTTKNIILDFATRSNDSVALLISTLKEFEDKFGKTLDGRL
ncbi:MAG: hypothetical protein LBK70_00185 [Clostridiales bacterium]|jgi:hypothetical protein|nr:hypothetical protein [Clostridiales bacterium]